MNQNDSTKTNCPPRSKRWETDVIVAELRAIREESLASRHRSGAPVKLPSRRVLSGVVEGIGAALFPNRLGRQDLDGESVDYFVGYTLDCALRDLKDQIRLELIFGERYSPSPEDVRDRASEITRHFAAHLPQIRRTLETDIQAAYEGDPAARSSDEVLACYPGMTAIIHHRLANLLYRLGAPLVARIIAEIAHSVTGIDIHPGATIGQSFFIDHGTGVVIGETAVVGDRV
jgi:serine O-acetyltransferase